MLVKLHFYPIFQVEQIRRDAEELKREFSDYLTSTSEDVEKFSVDTLVSTTVLDNLYIYSTDLTDRKQDKLILKEFQTVSEKLQLTDKDKKYDQHLNLKRPHLHDLGKSEALGWEIHVSKLLLYPYDKQHYFISLFSY